ncbi:hypothetical protein NW072_03860 [Mycoplasmopsis felis]|uniref:hypothetical protein n=1 Tax=Mycoplasmopsis felis TaxID=33923 RepID=UPI0021AF0C16|nr:hypothetical protein [Mycoplasmopsis felis]UWV79198.1 hypothetical protein NW072_03860 [Mycoplasmopsis felis]
MKKVLVPRVRFKGFNEDWKEDTIGNIANITNGKLDANAMVKSGCIIFIPLVLMYIKLISIVLKAKVYQ